MPFFMLHPREIEQTRKQKNAVVVDLRERAQFQKFHYKNAYNMPYKENERWLENFGKGHTYILYCDYGNVSLLVARKLSLRGISAYTVVGGVDGIRRYSAQNGTGDDNFLRLTGENRTDKI